MEKQSQTKKDDQIPKLDFKSLLKEYPILKDLGIGLLLGGGLSLAGRAAQSRGSSISPTLMGLLGVAAPFAAGAFTGTGTYKNVDRYGLPGFTTPTRHLKYLPNRRGYIEKYLKSIQGSGKLPVGYKFPKDLRYSELKPVNYFQNKARHPLVRKYDDRIVGRQVKEHLSDY